MNKASFILLTLLLISCTSKPEEERTEYNKAELTTVNVSEGTEKNNLDTTGTIPLDGKYRYDIAFAEWDGKSMGEKVTVVIKGNSIKVIYEGDGKLTAEKGEVLDEGIIMKHKSGNWIIGREKEDVNLDEIGGCGNGPTIIDFNNQKYWTC